MSVLDQEDRKRLSTQLKTIAEVTPPQEHLLAGIPLRVIAFATQDDIISQNTAPRHSCMILSGVACRYKLVADGKRQIVSIQLPGDMPDLASFYLDRVDHGIAALSACRVGFVRHEALRELIEREPSIGDLFVQQSLVEASILGEWVANVGARQAMMRVAHLFCELHIRMRALGLTRDGAIAPLTQSQIGDATGISQVHVNRVMQQLRRKGLITSQGNHHSVVDWSGLKAAGDFSPNYLHLRAPVLEALM